MLFHLASKLDDRGAAANALDSWSVCCLSSIDPPTFHASTRQVGHYFRLENDRILARGKYPEKTIIRFFGLLRLFLRPKIENSLPLSYRSSIHQVPNSGSAEKMVAPATTEPMTRLLSDYRPSKGRRDWTSGTLAISIEVSEVSPVTALPYVLRPS